MCGPALPLVAAGLGAATSAIGTISAIRQAHAQADAAQANAAAERSAAQADQQSTREAALAQYRQIAQATGQATVQAAASGVATGFGTAADSLGDTTLLGQDAIGRIYAHGQQALIGHDASVAGAMTQAGAASLRAQSLALGSIAGIAQSAASGSVLGGASQFAGLKAGFGL